MIVYGKQINDKILIFEIGETYSRMGNKKVNRRFLDWNGQQLFFYDAESAVDWINARNEINKIFN